MLFCHQPSILRAEEQDDSIYSVPPSCHYYNWNNALNGGSALDGQALSAWLGPDFLCGYSAEEVDAYLAVSDVSLQIRVRMSSPGPNFVIQTARSCAFKAAPFDILQDELERCAGSSGARGWILVAGD